MIGPWLRRLRMTFRRARLDAEMDEEIRTHLEMATEELLARGMSPEDARRAARRSFGGVEQLRERHREVRGIPWLEDLVRDVRLAARSLRRERGFTLTVVATLMIGIGADVAIVSVVEGVLLRPLPYPDAQRVVTVGVRRPGGARVSARFTSSGYQLFREANRSYQAIGAFSTSRMPLIGSGEPVQAVVNEVTNSAFDVLSVSPRLGRLPTEAEDVPGAPRVALLSHRLWTARFGSDPQILGRTIELNDTIRVVIGVLPPDVGFQDVEIDAWVPMRLDLSSPDTRASRYHLIGRLRADATPESASVEADRLIQRLPEVGHAPVLLTTILSGDASVLTVKEQLVGGSRDLLLVVLGAVSLVLLIALSNVAALFVVRAEERARQRAVRAVLGASRRRLVQYALSEALLLTLAGGVGGLLLALAGTRALIELAPSSIPRLDGVGISRLVLAYAGAVSAGAGVAFALLPAWGLRSARRFAPALSGAGRTTTAGPGRLRLRGALVAVEVALAVVLLIGSGLMVRSYASLRSVDPGFDPDDVTTFGLVLPTTRYSNAEASSLYLRLVERLRRLPDVESAGVTTGLPVTPVQAAYRLEIEDVPDGTDVFVVRWVTPGYFETMGIPVVSGRTMQPDDVEEFRLFISASLAEQHWTAASALGRRIGPPGLLGEVLGVVGDDRIRGLDLPVESAIYAPIASPSAPALLSVAVVVRTRTGRTDIVPLLRREVGVLDPELPLIDVRSMHEVISESYAVSRASFTLLLFTVSAAVALLLGAVGIYGVIAYAVSRRAPEIGVRMALGATSGRILSHVLAVGMVPVGVGLAAGLLIAALGSRTLSSLLFETSRLDVPTFLAGPGVLLLVAAAACIVPTRRAIRLDPVRALRTE